MKALQEAKMVSYFEKCYSLTTDKNETLELKDPFAIAKNCNSSAEKPLQWFLKRAVDFTGSLIGLITLSPLLAVVALAISIESRGPVIFKQKRLGMYGKEFYMYKFRSMVENAESELANLEKYNETNSGMFKMTDDPRVTKIGKFIRKYSIDELPQLFNVLKGEMSLVGFRPPIKRELKSYKSWHYLRFASMPGLTGVWQVSGRSDIKDFDEVVKLEYNYAKSWSFISDLILLLKTLPVVIFGKGAA